MMTQMHQQTQLWQRPPIAVEEEEEEDCVLAAIHFRAILAAVAFLHYYLHSIVGEDLLLMAEYHVIFHGLFCLRPQKAKVIRRMCINNIVCIDVEID